MYPYFDVEAALKELAQKELKGRWYEKLKAKADNPKPDNVISLDDYRNAKR